VLPALRRHAGQAAEKDWLARLHSTWEMSDHACILNTPHQIQLAGKTPPEGAKCPPQSLGHQRTQAVQPIAAMPR